MRKNKNSLNQILIDYIKRNGIDLNTVEIQNGIDRTLAHRFFYELSYGKPLSIVPFNIIMRSLGSSMVFKLKRNGSIIQDTIIDGSRNNYFKVSLKEVLINEMIMINQYRDKFKSCHEFDKMTTELNTDTPMDYNTFNRWCEILDIQHECKLISNKECLCV